MVTLTIPTREREQLIDVTNQLKSLVQQQGWQNGALLLFCPHTTCAVTINEAADPSVVRDVAVTLDRLAPEQGDYKHAEGNSDAHVKSTLVGCDQWLIVSDGQLQLGIWQGVFFCEFDGPRNRKLLVQFLPA